MADPGAAGPGRGGSAIFQPGVASTPLIAHDVQKANATLRISESVTAVIGPSAAGLLACAGHDDLHDVP